MKKGRKKAADPLREQMRARDLEIDRKNGITRCTGCRYYRPAGSVPDLYMMCHYALDTGRLRGTRPEDCYRQRMNRKKGGEP